MGRLADNPLIRITFVAAVFGAAIATSVAAGTPTQLPSAALGWSVLMHIERAAMALAVVGSVLLVSWRTTGGSLPTRIGQVEYPAPTPATAYPKDLELRICSIEDMLLNRAEGTGVET